MLTLSQLELSQIRDRKYQERSLALIGRTWTERDERRFHDALASIATAMTRWPVQVDVAPFVGTPRYYRDS